MSSMQFTRSAIGALDYGNPFVGPIDHTAPAVVDLSDLTNKEIDARGYLKPGIPLTSAAALAAALTRSTPDAGTVTTGNANGVISAVSGGWGAPAESITVTFTTTGATAAFTVEGTVSGFIATGAVGTPFASPIINFSIADGSTDWEVGDVVTFVVTAGVSNRIFGVTIEPVKVADDNEAGTLAALSTLKVILATIGQVNRDILEDNLGRALTAAEVAAFADSTLVLI